MINSTFLQTKNNNMNNSTKTTTTSCVLSSQLQQSQTGLLAIETKTGSSPGRTRKKTSVLLSALLIAMFSVFCNNVSSQISGYTFSSSANTYTAVAGTTISTTTWDEESTTAVLPIEFSFDFGGTSFTTFGVNNNGWIRLGANPVWTYTPISSQATNDIIAPFARDLQGQTGSSIQYTTTGSAPNRILTVQWTSSNPTSASARRISSRVKASRALN